jgi:hypothetical protein
LAAQYAVILSDVSAPGCGTATGVDTDGTYLFFDCLFKVVEADLSGQLINTFALSGTYGAGEESSLVENFSPPPPGGTVPEPRTIASFASGVLLLIMMLRRKLGRA